MRALIQRVKEASVLIEGKVHDRIGTGLLVLLGVHQKDVKADAGYLAKRTVDLRIFGDGEGKMNLSIKDTDGSILVISQFTLYADTRKGNRPSFAASAAPDHAENLYNSYVQHLRQYLAEEKVKTGVFRAMMDIALINDGPVTVMLESKESASGAKN